MYSLSSLPVQSIFEPSFVYRLMPVPIKSCVEMLLFHSKCAQILYTHSHKKVATPITEANSCSAILTDNLKTNCSCNTAYGKCKCLHSGHGNKTAQYTMSDTVLNTTVKEEVLGLTIRVDMKVSEQCGIAAAKGLIRRNIVYKEKELIIPLYKTVVRPHLDYCIQAWRPYRKKDIDILERIQRRATKMIPKLRNISYEMRGDQIEVLKNLNGYENIHRNTLFSIKEERRTRGHGITLAKKQCRLDIRKF